jgi:V-type H+-transporting ATPase subunit C
LESLITLSEELPKQDAYFTSVVLKVVEILKSLLNNEPTKVSQHIRINDIPEEEYLTGPGWSWNAARYNLQRSLREITDSLSKASFFVRARHSQHKLTHHHLPTGNGFNR